MSPTIRPQQSWSAFRVRASRRIWTLFVLTLLATGPAVNAHADVNVSVSPRFWAFFDDVSFPGGQGTGPNGNSFIAAQDPFLILMYGGSLSVSSTDFLPTTAFTFTALYGEADERRTNLGGAINFLPPDMTFPAGRTEIVFTENINEQDLERVDLELTAQTKFNDLSSWIVGLRYERTRIDFDSRNRFGVARTNPPISPGDPGQPGFVSLGGSTSGGKGGYDLVSGRVGVAGSVPLAASGKHLLYANLLFFVGYQEEVNRDVTAIFEDRWLGGPDVSIGYVWSATDWMSFDLRYRALFFFPFSGEASSSAPEATHGLNLGVNFRIPSTIWPSW